MWETWPCKVVTAWPLGAGSFSICVMEGSYMGAIIIGTDILKEQGDQMHTAGLTRDVCFLTV